MLGGLALKKAFTRRYEREEFEALTQEVFNILRKRFKTFSLPRYFADKESFGDMDIIISLDNIAKEDIRAYIDETFKPTEVFPNGNAWSFDYKEIQIDFITCAPEDYGSNYHYLAFNDLGNFIGRLAQQIGLKYGQEGLWYNHFTENTKTKIMISKNYKEIFAFLGLDYSKWVTGFNSLEEIFEYTMTSKYFNPYNFQLSQLNKINRDRNFKRKSYMSFLDYIEDKEPNINYNQDTIDDMKLNITSVVEEAFPECNISLELKRLAYEEAKSRYVTGKFNGHLVMERYGLKNKELGDSIKNFKATINKYAKEDNYNSYIINTSEEAIWATFEECNDLVHM